MTLEGENTVRETSDKDNIPCEAARRDSASAGSMKECLASELGFEKFQHQKIEVRAWIAGGTAGERARKYVEHLTEEDWSAHILFVSLFPYMQIGREQIFQNILREEREHVFVFTKGQSLYFTHIFMLNSVNKVL